MGCHSDCRLAMKLPQLAGDITLIYRGVESKAYHADGRDSTSDTDCRMYYRRKISPVNDTVRQLSTQISRRRSVSSYRTCSISVFPDGVTRLEDTVSLYQLRLCVPSVRGVHTFVPRRCRRPMCAKYGATRHVLHVQWH